MRRGCRDGRDSLLIFVGRPSWLSTSRPVATPPIVIAVAKYSGLPTVGPSRRPDMRDDRFSGLTRAGREAAEGERGAHQLQKTPPRDRIADRLNLRRELVDKLLVKGRIVRVFVQRAPEASGWPWGSRRHRRHRHRHRWQVEQLVSDWMPYSATRRRPTAS
jgi:hypothetical protein